MANKIWEAYNMDYVTNKLEERYPETKKPNVTYDDVCDPHDPFYLALLGFRREIAESDRKVFKQKNFKDRFYRACHHYPTLCNLSVELKVDEDYLKEFMIKNRECYDLFKRCNQAYNRVSIQDTKTDRTYQFSTGVAAEFMAIRVDELKFRLTERDPKELVHGRYKIKRTLWDRIDRQVG